MGDFHRRALCVLLGVVLTSVVGCRGGSDGTSAAGGADAVVTNDAEPTDYQSAFRFLRQATFGPAQPDLDVVMDRGIRLWLDQQLAMISAYEKADDGHLTHLQRLEQVALALEPYAVWYPPVSEDVVPAPAASFFNGGASHHSADYQMGVWFENALDGPDQLRQRVAYALSQILVTSAHEFPLGQRAESLAFYYDILARNAFGDFRTLLGEVARSPAMGVYLSHQGNRKANAAANTVPDENFARELMQLFTVGLYRLNMDGTPMRDSDGHLIPTYTQADVEEMARVMTGWDLRFNARFGSTDGSYVHYMEMTPEFHDFGEKNLLGTTIPAHLTGSEDLDAALDILFQHANVGPFIGRQLIQRLVTSNPSPDYVARVARVFNDNGQGVRGDLGAVVRAILLDDEARSAVIAAREGFGKANEHLLAYTALYRAFDAQPLDGWQIDSDHGGVPVDGIYYFRIQSDLGQGPLRAHHVFNFYDPDFVPQSSFYQDSDPQGVMPEMQLRTPNNIAALFNTLSLRNSVYERNDLIDAYGSVEEFVAQQTGWNWRKAIALVDYSPALAAFERGMEGDANGDFASINDGVDEHGFTPKEKGIAALLDFLELRLLGARVLPPEFRVPLARHLHDAPAFNRSEPRTEAIRTVAGAVQYVMLSADNMAQQ